MAPSGDCLLIMVVGIHAAFFCTEIVLGEKTNSVALVGDSYRILTDGLSLTVCLFASKLSRCQTEKNTYGWVRAYVLGGFVNGIFLLALCFAVVLEAVKRFIFIKELDNPVLVLAVGGLGLLFNVVCLIVFGTKTHGVAARSRKLRSVGEPDSLKGSRTHSLNAYWIVLHVVGSLFGSVTIVVIAVLALYGDSQWCHYADPVLSICLVSILVASTIPLLRESAHIMLQTVPQHIDVQVLKKKLRKQVPELDNIHELHVWQLTGDESVATLHFVTSAPVNFLQTFVKVKKFFREAGIEGVAIQPEIPEAPEVDVDSQECLLKVCGETCAKWTCCNHRNKKSVSRTDCELTEVRATVEGDLGTGDHRPADGDPSEKDAEERSELLMKDGRTAFESQAKQRTTSVDGETEEEEEEEESRSLRGGDTEIGLTRPEDDSASADLREVV